MAIFTNDKSHFESIIEKMNNDVEVVKAEDVIDIDF
jgi:hypothetical protein